MINLPEHHFAKRVRASFALQNAMALIGKIAQPEVPDIALDM